MIINEQNKKLNIDFNNDREYEINLWKDIYGTHARVGNEVYGDFPEVKKIDDYLYEITIDEIDQDYALDYIKQIGGACSEARKDNIIIRSYDWYWDLKTSFIVRTLPKENRHASIGISSVSITEQELANKKYNELFKAIPHIVLDGINDCGVYCGMNVVPANDKGRTTGTNPGKKDLPNICMIRPILDNATSVDHAIAILKNRNIFAVKYDGELIELHMLLADTNKTVIVEFVNNKMVVIPQDNSSTIMTNFYHTDWNGEIKSVALGNTVEETKATGLTPHAEGLERYNILKAGLDSVDSLESGMDLIRKVKFTNAYNREMNPFWYSELVGAKDLTIYNTKEEYDPVVDIFIEMFNNRDRNRPDTWQTVHCSCYNLTNKELLVSCQEQDATYRYSLDANKVFTSKPEKKITWGSKI